MTRYDFNEIAEVVKDQMLRTARGELGPDAEDACVHIADGIAKHAAAVNERFDRRLFLRSCGIHDTVRERYSIE